MDKRKGDRHQIPGTLVRLDPADRAECERMAQEWDVSLNWIIRRAVKEFLASERNLELTR